MSFTEPKAPIVRIRKKRVKRKSKDNDIVHLPVRASQQPRYSSLTTPPNPQTKSRECCRHCFAGCMRIPVCKLICFRCILPKCYGGSGSDDEEADIKDEGYHSQNRRSSEISPNPEGGAEGGADPQEVEMTELKGESTKLIPPPRTTVNDYRKEPFKEPLNKSKSKANGDVVYIEVESVSLSGSNTALDIPGDDMKVEDTTSKEFSVEMLEQGYEEPVQVGILEFPILKSLETDNASENLEDDNSEDSESRIYINESVLGIVSDSNEINKVESKSSTKRNESRTYLNLGPSKSDPGVIHSKQRDEITAISEKPHEYVNISSLETKSDTSVKSVRETKSETGLKATLVKTKSDSAVKSRIEIKYNTVVKSIPETNSSKELQTSTEEKKNSTEKDETNSKNESNDVKLNGDTKAKDLLSEIDDILVVKLKESLNSKTIDSAVDKDHEIGNKDNEHLIEKKSKHDSQLSESDDSVEVDEHLETGAVESDQTKLI